MSFFDEDPMALPCDGQYYFNVLMINCAINPRCAKEYLGEGVDSIWYMEKINEPRPYALYCYVEPMLKDTDTDYKIEREQHCVIEISNQMSPCWYPMLDFETPDSWAIELDDGFDEEDDDEWI